MEEFLNSEKFYQMAKEYNKKYNSISVLNSKVLDSKEVTKVLQNIYKFLFLLKKGFYRNRRFKDVFDRVEKLEKVLLDIQNLTNIEIKKDFSGEKGLFINHKTFVLLILEIINDIFNFEIQGSSSQIEELFDAFYSVISAFYRLI